MFLHRKLCGLRSRKESDTAEQLTEQMLEKMVVNRNQVDYEKHFFFGKSSRLIGVIFSFQCSRLEDMFHVCFPQDILFAKAWKHIDGIQDNYTQIWNLDILNLLAEGV